MDYELIVAHSQSNVIGNNNKLPWSVPEDLKHFYEITKNSIIIMGRKTYESMPVSGLKNRINIVLTTNTPPDNPNPNITYANMSSIFNIVDELRKIENKKVFIIGGSEIYKLFIDHCKILHITIIHEDIVGDVYFPINIGKLVMDNVYKNIYTSEVMYSKNNNIKYQYFTYERCD